MRTRSFGPIYIAGLLLALHHAFTIYINSSFLSTFFKESTLSFFYTAAALLSLVGLIISPQVIRKFPLIKLTITLLIVEVVALVGLWVTSSPLLIALFFIVHAAMPLLLVFYFDIILETLTVSERKTGTIRSNYMTFINLAFVVSPIIVGTLISIGTYRNVYAISAIFLLILIVLMSDMFKKLKAHPQHEINFKDSMRKFTQRKDLGTVYSINFLLHCFYAFMVIFMPIYLTTIGFEWATIGAMFTIMLLPFVLFEAPLGRIFDRIQGEKDILVIGFVIMSLACVSMFFMREASVVFWTLALFISRVGASFVEIGSEYAFFRKVNDQDGGFISVFRTTTPVAYIITPALAGGLSTMIDIPYLFLIAGVCLFYGTTLAYKLRS